MKHPLLKILILALSGLLLLSGCTQKKPKDQLLIYIENSYIPAHLQQLETLYSLGFDTVGMIASSSNLLHNEGCNMSALGIHQGNSHSENIGLPTQISVVTNKILILSPRNRIIAKQCVDNITLGFIKGKWQIAVTPNYNQSQFPAQEFDVAQQKKIFASQFTQGLTKIIKKIKEQTASKKKAVHITNR
jgi:hypothetical protein